MASRRLLRLGTGLFVATAVFALLATPAAGAAETEPAAFEYHAADLLADGSDEETNRTVKLVLEGTASEGDVLRIAIQESERDAFDITGVSNATGDIGIAVTHTTDAIEIELTDLGGNGTLTGAEVTMNASLRATDAVASSAATYNAATIGRVEENDTDVGLDGESALSVSITEAAEIGFTAEKIDETADYGFFPLVEYDTFVISFANEGVWVDDGESINLSVDPDSIKSGTENGFSLRDVWEESTQNENISSVNITTSNQANVLDGNTDQITVTINTVNGDPKLISGEAVAINMELLIKEESVKYATNRYHRADFLEVDVEGENNTELTDNADIRTESPLFVDIYPSKVTEFSLGGPEAGSEIAISENRSIPIETAQDRFGNEIRTPTLEATLSGAEKNYTYAGIGIDTADRDGPILGRGHGIKPLVGVFDLTVQVTDTEGGATDAEDDVTATVENLTIYPGNVTVRTGGRSNDFDADGGETELAVDLGVTDEEIDRLDLELRRVAGEGTVTLNDTEGTPTKTDLWRGTEYAGDGEMRPENTWVIERDLTAADFDGGVRKYTLQADTAGRYEVAVDALPYEERLVADETEVRSSTTDAHGNATRGTVDIVATGPIEAITNVSVRSDRGFVGVEADPGNDIVVYLGRFVDANGNRISKTDETVTVGVGNETIQNGVGNGSVTADVGPTANDPAATVTLDPTAINATAVETGSNATVAVAFEEGRQLNATAVTLVHRVTEPDGSGWHAGSVPQPATLYVDADGARDVTHWNPRTERYESLADGTENDVLDGERIEAEHLHRGFYFRSEDDHARLGFDFVTDSEVSTNATDGSETVELDEGWHFGSSNYDVSSHTQRDLEDDLNWSAYGFSEGDDAFVVRNSTGGRLHDRTNGTDINGTTTAVDQNGTYWIRVRSDTDAPLVRDIVRSTYTEADGIQR